MTLSHSLPEPHLTPRRCSSLTASRDEQPPESARSVDLLQNRDANAVLGSFDGRVGAIVQIGCESFFITTNVDYIPATPSLVKPHQVFQRTDMRFGTDDPTLWPQLYSETFCHLGAIPQREASPELSIMWWNPERSDFISGSTVTSRLGKLANARLLTLQQLTIDIVARAMASRGPLSSAWPLVSKIGRAMDEAISRLRSIPSDFEEMVLGVTTVQRLYLELHGLLDYMLVYKPRMEGWHTAAPSAVGNCIGTFVYQPEVAQRFHSAGLPFWLYRPLEAFYSDNILAVTTPREPPPTIDLPRLAGRSVVFSGNSTDAKISAMQAAAAQSPWYHDPFANSETSLATPLRVESSVPQRPSMAEPSKAPAVSKQSKYHPYARPPEKKQNVPADRNKFDSLAADEMPIYITSWLAALRLVPGTGNKTRSTDTSDTHYVLPEPALLASAERLERRQLVLHHWVLLKDVFYYRLVTNAQPMCLSSQEWREVLSASRMLDPAARPNKRRKNARTIASIIGPALRKFSIDTPANFPPPPETYPTYTMTQARQIIWEVAETNFRFELMALDRRASQKSREEEVRLCYPGGMLLGIPLEYSQEGLASPNLKRRLHYLNRLARLMLDWKTECTRPTGINHSVLSKADWSEQEIRELEWAVARYYIQSFFEYFGRPAVLPMGLNLTT